MSIMENRPTSSVVAQVPVGRDSHLDVRLSIMENRPTSCVLAQAGWETQSYGSSSVFVGRDSHLDVFSVFVG